MHSAALGAAAHARFEDSTQSTLGLPELSKDGVPQLAGDACLGVCSLPTVREPASCNTETAFSNCFLKTKEERDYFFLACNENKGEVWKPHL